MKKITDIHCPNCGAPAQFDIVHQKYVCDYCGSGVGIDEAVKEKQGFRNMRSKYLSQTVKDFDLFSASCSGCGATIVFKEKEALSNCAFCGRSLVRSAYVNTKGMPECIIPFSITKEEAMHCLEKWCLENKRKREAKKLKPLTSQMEGFYLPYELIRGPVHMNVSRIDGWRKYHCEGFINDAFVNCSRQLDNLMLDGMEPFDVDAMEEFDFGYVAGHKVKISDIDDKVLEKRVKEEAESSYRPSARQTMETKAVEVDANVKDALRLPVLLPVYYICRNNLMASVNGQTGKVSVRAEKESHYYFLPWWLKAIAATLVFCSIIFEILHIFGMNTATDLILTGALGLYFFIVNMCVYSDTTKNRFSIESGREIFTSGQTTFHREGKELIKNDTVLQRKITEPTYFADIKGRSTPVKLRFTTPLRVMGMLVLAAVVLFLPVIFALVLNGFNFSKLNWGGSAVWFCIFVPVVPIYLLKFGIVELHDNPWIYYQPNENGRYRRYRKGWENGTETLKDILKVIFIPPASLLVWLGIVCFCVIVYLTSGI